jgi:di/tripeptidase
LEPLRNVMRQVVEEVTGKPITFKSASTDCNIPFSLGIPAMCVGVYIGGGTHTREEWVDKASMIPGMEIAIRVAKMIVEE